ncbi:glycosyltransferase [Sphingomonas montana]|uniref:glycosyltransferase n=1 Tax=Sphingomonas montana TaxID=1843236 RepID=UPI0019D14D56|nr:glycosyltransferase [Sphingomonas montana]
MTDSRDPSGVGCHMLTLASGMAASMDIVVGAPEGSPLLADAVRRGLGVIASDAPDAAGLRRRIAHGGYDIVHVHAGIGWEGHGLAAAARDAGVGAVVRTEHLPYLLTDADQRAAHDAGLDMIDRLICVSDGVADSHRAAGVRPDLLTVIRNGIDAVPATRDRTAMRQRFGIGDAPVLLMVARFAAQKGHDLLLDALPYVIRAHPDLVVLLVGEGPLLSPIARAVAARGLAGRVRMLGRRDDVPNLMAAADLLVLPSRFEGLPLVVLEAMASGLPVAATATLGTAEVILPGRTGWLAEAAAGPLAAAICDALSDPDVRTTVAAAARDHHAAHYRADRMIAETVECYQGLPRTEGNSMQKTRIGFIGAGGIAHRHFGVLETFDDVAIVAVCDPDLVRATDAAARFGARAFDDAAEMLDAVPLDAVYICVPPFAHGAPERAVLAKGLPFFVEKPVALDIATADAIAAEVAERGVVTAVGYHWRYLDTVDEVRAMLARNPARLMSGYWLDSTPPPVWWWHADQSGGQMVEQTTHLLDLARYLAGDVTRAYGLAGHLDRPEFPGLDVPTVSTASLLFRSGAVANFASTCLLKWNHRVGLHIFGDGFAIELTDRDVMIDTGHGRPVRGAEGDPVWREDRDFIDAVQGGENRIRCPYGDAVETHRLALAVVESARCGMAVTLGDA